MIDFQVAFDKLAQFQHSDELADFLKGEGVVGTKEAENDCPLARYVYSLTQMPVAVQTETMTSNGRNCSMTGPMTDFVNTFDNSDLYDFLKEENDCECC